MKISDTKKLAAITAAFFITVTAFSGCSESASSSQTTNSVSQSAKSDIDASIAAEDIDVGYDEESSIGITFADGSAAIDGEGATSEGETVTISQAGTYILSGTATNGRIIVSADKTAEIKLIFNGVDITCADNAPLLVSKAKKVYIVLEDGTENVLTDSASYSLGEDDSNTDGAIFSKADLTINGSGTLTVNANYKHGIVSKDDLVITDGNINVTRNWQSNMSNGGGGPNGMGRPDDNGNGTGGDLPAMPTADNTGLTIKTTANTTTDSDSTSTSAKALKAGNEVNISGGEFKIDSADDSVHSNGNIVITGGNISVASGDNGMHADGNLTISDGTVDITKSYEGIEGAIVTIDGGTISVVASDDGINCAGGSDTGSTDRMGADQFSSQDGVELNINGGTVTIDAEGDGLDSNGNFTMAGGTVCVCGPTNGGNGALDYNGTATVTGGTLIACGAVGMEEGFGDSSTQYSVLHDLGSTVSANEKLTITDSEGKEILSFTPKKTWQSVVFTSADLKEGETYTITAGSQSETVTIDGIVTSNSKGMSFGRGHGGGRGF